MAEEQIEQTIVRPKDTRPTSPSGGSSPPSSRGLPHDLLLASAKRLRIAAIVYAMVFFFANFATAIVVGEGGALFSSFRGWGPGAISIVVSLLMAWLTTLRSIPSRTLLNIGLIYEVVGCLGISFAQYWHIYSRVPIADGPVEGIGLSWVAVWVVMFSVVVPNKPWKTFAAALASGLTVPIVIALSMKYGGTAVRVSPSMFFGALIMPYVIIAAMAYFSAKILYKLGTDVTRAREMGSYRLVDCIGRGGMGEVWQAKHRLLARPAAIKLVRPEVLEGDGPESAQTILKRFEREAQTTASMRSPHTVHLYDFGIADDGTFYYVMELLDGFNLETLVKQLGPLGEGRAAHLLDQICHSLSEAHKEGLIHRDIKPANVFTCRYGQDVDFVKVLDFGLVKSKGRREEEDVRLTAVNVAGGTPAYMAPEQILGNAPVGPGTDIYALGCLGYWLLTGQLVFEADTVMAAAMHHVQTPPVPPSKRTELNVSDEMDRLILACLAKKPEQRPDGADAVREMLAAIKTRHDWSAEQAQQWWGIHHP